MAQSQTDQYNSNSASSGSFKMGSYTIQRSPLNKTNLHIAISDEHQFKMCRIISAANREEFLARECQVLQRLQEIQPKENLLSCVDTIDNGDIMIVFEPKKCLLKCIITPQQIMEKFPHCRLPESHIKVIMKQVLQAIHHCHEAGIVLRKLSIHSLVIFLQPTMPPPSLTVAIVDFSNAKLVEGPLNSEAAKEEFAADMQLAGQLLLALVTGNIQ